MGQIQRSNVFHEFPRLFWGKVFDCNMARWTTSFLDASLVQSLLEACLNPIKIGENVINAVKGHGSDVLLKELGFPLQLLTWGRLKC